MVLRSLGWCFLIAGPLLLAASCASEPLAPKDRASEPVRSWQDFADSFPAAACDAQARCCAGQRFDFDLESCRASTAQLMQDLFDQAAQLEVTFNPAAAQRCVEEASSYLCPEEPRDPFDDSAGCDPVFEGHLEPGELCSLDVECRVEAPRLAFCDVEQGCVIESLPARAAAGERCSGTCFESLADGTDCFEVFPRNLPDGSSLPDCYISDGLQCSPFSETCEVLLALGEGCVLSDECQDGAFCGFESGTCEARRSSGRCNDEIDACDSESSCDFETDQCVPRRRSNGARCERDGDCESYYCNPYSVCQPGVTAEQCAGGF